ncbi:hypothetical protein RAS1_26050 [Phycisphaerae bacterium RAS1]|nr:hypothetical protein RAS1_26050 [Phycisphaerae bacterium RAS1]
MHGFSPMSRWPSRFAGCLAILGCGASLLLAPAPLSAQEPSAVQPTAPAVQPAQPPPDAVATQPAGPAERIVQLNEGLRAFDAGDDEEAIRILSELTAAEPDNVAGQYYLGLAYLRRGLKLSGEWTRAAETGEANAAELSELAREQFEQAAQRLERVSAISDKTLIPIEAALDLGIAHLAKGDPEGKANQRAIALRAAQTLEEYTRSEHGKNDRVGHFFLGVAYYRLNYYADERGWVLREGKKELQRARDLLEADRRAGRVNEEDARLFEVRQLYYLGLLNLAQDNKSAAINNLLDVRGRVVAGDLMDVNAERLIDAIRKKQGGSQKPITFDSPLGEIRFEGELSMGYFYDSNVILLGKDTSLPRGIAQKYDHRFGLQAGFDVSRLLTGEDDGILGKNLLIGIGFTTANFWQPSIQEFDQNSFQGRAYANWEFVDDLFLGLEYSHTYTKLGTDPFIGSNRLTPVITKYWRTAKDQDPLARTDLYYIYDLRDYFERLTLNAFDRDGKYQAVGVTQAFNLARAADLWTDYYKVDDRGVSRDFGDARRFLVARFGYLFRDETTRGTEFDLIGNTISAMIEVPLPWRLTVDALAEFTWDHYLRRSAFDYDGKNRSDFIQHYDFGITRTFVERGENEHLPTLRVRLRAGVELTFQDSNIWDRLGQDIYSYDRAIYNVRLMINF